MIVPKEVWEKMDHSFFPECEEENVVDGNVDECSNN